MTAFAFLASPLGFAAGQQAGDLWSVRSQPQIAGMPFPMPAQTSQVCAARQWTAPPAGSGPDPTCVNSDFQLMGTTATWKITCQQPASTGEGSITRMGEDAYTGTIMFAMPQGQMTIALTGERVGGCDNPS
jgi:hypothetical protein